MPVLPAIWRASSAALHKGCSRKRGVPVWRFDRSTHRDPRQLRQVALSMRLSRFQT